MESWAYDVIVVDSTTHIPLPNASIYDKDGSPVGLSNNNGEVPKIRILIGIREIFRK